MKVCVIDNVLYEIKGCKSCPFFYNDKYGEYCGSCCRHPVTNWMSVSSLCHDNSEYIEEGCPLRNEKKL